MVSGNIGTQKPQELTIAYAVTRHYLSMCLQFLNQIMLVSYIAALLKHMSCWSFPDLRQSLTVELGGHPTMNQSETM